MVIAPKKEKKKKEEEKVVVPEEKKPSITTPPPIKQTQPEILRNEEGRVVGVALPDGRTLMGIDKEEAFGQAQAFLGKQAIPAGTIEAEQAGAQRAEQQRLQALTAQTGNLTPEQKQILEEQARQQVGVKEPMGLGLGILPENINLAQAATAGAAEAGIYGAGAGIVTGMGSNPVSWGAIVAGSAAGFIKGAYSDIKQQQAGLVTAQGMNVDKAITQLNNIISARNLGADEIESAMLYQQTISNAYQGWAELKLQTQGTVKAFDDGTVELEKYEIFFREGGVLDSINFKFNQALVNPNPSKIAAESYEAYMSSGE